MSSSQQPSSTYHTGRQLRSTSHHEWRNALNSAAHLLPTFQAKISQNPKLKLLDIGCGSGTITVSLAKYMPEGHITAIDQSAAILEKAKLHAEEEGVKNVNVLEGNAYELPFEEEQFDVLHCSMVLAHLSHPILALKEMIRVTRKQGGVISLREPDLKAWSFYPSLEGMKEFSRVQCLVHGLNGGHVDAAQKLVTWLLQTGQVERENIKCSVGGWCYSTPEERRMWGAVMVGACEGGGMRERALKEGIVSEVGFDNMKRDWETWIGAEDGWFGCLNGEVLVFL